MAASTGRLLGSGLLNSATTFTTRREILFGPLSAVTTLGTRVEGDLLVCEARLNINLQALTLEEVIAKMRTSHLSLCTILGERATTDELRTQLVRKREEALSEDAERFNLAHVYNAKNDAVLRLFEEGDCAACRADFERKAPYALKFRPAESWSGGIVGLLKCESVRHLLVGLLHQSPPLTS